jgi:hypothetical protein
MKKLIASIFVLAAMGPFYAIPESNPAFVPSGRGSQMNMYNEALRFGQGGRIAIPGEGGQHSSENSSVAPYSTEGSQSIVDPQGAF